jgi:N-acetylmuramoyl-L-alanine amidase
VKQGGEDAPCQFSFWCDRRPDEPEEGESWARARAVAAELLASPPPDPTHGAILYPRADLRPAWARQHRETARVGRHIFYR